MQRWKEPVKCCYVNWRSTMDWLLFAFVFWSLLSGLGCSTGLLLGASPSLLLPKCQCLEHLMRLNSLFVDRSQPPSLFTPNIPRLCVKLSFAKSGVTSKSPTKAPPQERRRGCRRAKKRFKFCRCHTKCQPSVPIRARRDRL